MDKMLAERFDLKEVKTRALVRQYDDPEMDVHISLGNWNTPRPSKQASAVTSQLIDTFGETWIYDEDAKAAHAAFLAEERDPRSLHAEQEARKARDPHDSQFNSGYYERDEVTSRDTGVDKYWFLDPVTNDAREFSSNPAVEYRPEVYDLGWVAGPVYSDGYLQEKAHDAVNLWHSYGWTMPIPIPGNICAPPEEPTAKDLPRCTCGRFLDHETQRCWKTDAPASQCTAEPFANVVARMASEAL